jgi:nucleoside phosphorylase
MTQKTLLSFAHPGEAQFFLNDPDFRFKKNAELPYFYEGEDCDLILTGEGVTSALFRITQVLEKMNVQKGTLYRGVINLGIVGSISSKLKIWDVVSVRTVYNLVAHKMQFHSFTSQITSALTSVDLVTVQDRVLDFKSKVEISGFGDVIDRELWALAYVCQNYKLPWYSLKVVSDNLTQETDCKLIFDQKEEFSKILKESYLKHDPFHSEKPGTQSKLETGELNLTLEQKILNHPNFHWTESLKNEFKKFLNLVSDVQEVRVENMIESLVQDTSLTPKVRSIKLIEELRSISNPLMAEYKRKRDRLAEIWGSKGILIQYDSKGENLDLVIKFSCSTQQGLQNKVSVLKQMLESENLDQL